MVKWLAAMLVGACALAAPAQAVEVDVELVLAVDSSRSIDGEEFELQRRGYATALTSSRVLDAIKGGLLGRIAVAYVEWSGSGEQKTVVDWTLIENAASAQQFADAVLAAPRHFSTYTSISGAIDHSVPLFEANGFEGRRKVIDISGDGSNNSGRPAQRGRDAAVAAGITINGLVIMNDRPILPARLHGRPELPLDAYYSANVIGGDGAFLIAAEDFHAFGTALTAKLVREIAALPGDRAVRLARAD